MTEKYFDYHDIEYKNSRHEYIEKIREIVEQGPPVAETDWNTIWVLSGPEYNFEEPGEGDKPNQTKNRFETGISVAKEVATIRADDVSDDELQDVNQYLPEIYFNGTDLQNDYIRDLIKNKVFEKDYSYPSNKIIVSPNLGITNTGDQFDCISKANIISDGKLVTVTDLYHIPRIEKYFNKYKITDKGKIVLYPALPMNLPVERALSEAKKIFPYTQQGIL
jgi:hypothetical protein